MLYSADAITHVRVRSVDGAYGDIKDLYFDDVAWIIRYLVVDTGGWLSGRKVLISPQALSEFASKDQAFPTGLTREQIAGSPAFDSEKTVSRQQEEHLSRYYGWAPYWATPMGVYPWPGIYTYPPYPAGPSSLEPEIQEGLPQKAADELNARRDEEPESHLRSLIEVKKYGLRATDGDLGQLDDLLIEPGSWRILYMIADARKWWPGGQVVIDRELIENISWDDQKIAVAMTRDEVKQAPAYQRSQGISERYQHELARYYQGFRERLRSERRDDHSVWGQSLPL